MANKKPGDKGLRNTVIGTVVFMVVALSGVVAYSNSSKNASLPGGTSSKDNYGIVFNSSGKPRLISGKIFSALIAQNFTQPMVTSYRK